MLTKLVNVEWRTIDTYRAEQSSGSAPAKSGSWSTCQRKLNSALSPVQHTAILRSVFPSTFPFLSFPLLSFPRDHTLLHFGRLRTDFYRLTFSFFFFFFFFQWNRNAKRWRNFSKNQRDIHERFVYYHRLAICFEIWKRSWLTFDKYYFSSFAFYRLWNNTCWKRFYPAVRYSWNKFRSTELLEFRNYFPVSSCRKFLKSRRLSWMNWPLWIYLMK